MTSHVRQAVSSFDLWGSAGHKMGDCCNILAMPSGGDTLTVLAPEGISSSHLASGFNDFKRDEVVGTFDVRWLIDPPNLDGCELMFILGAKLASDVQVVTWIIDSDAQVVPLGCTCDSGLKVFEMFAGGYGGWHSAATFMKHVQPFPAQFVAIDSCPEAVAQYAVSHRAQIVPGDVPLPEPWISIESPRTTASWQLSPCGVMTGMTRHGRASLPILIALCGLFREQMSPWSAFGDDHSERVSSPPRPMTRLACRCMPSSKKQKRPSSWDARDSTCCGPLQRMRTVDRTRVGNCCGWIPQLTSHKPTLLQPSLPMHVA